MALNIRPCPTCPRLRGPVSPTGPQPAQILLIGENPHKTEDKRRIPFSGPFGRELDNTYLIAAGLTRPQVATAYTMQCSLGGYRSPEPSEAKHCADYHLPTIIAHYDPEIIVVMGAVACHLAYPRVDLETQHGIPFIGRIYDWTGIIVPTYSPAAGAGDSRIMIQLLDDWPIVREVRHGLESHPIVDAHPEWSHARLQTKAQVQHALSSCSNQLGVSIAIDTETDCQGFELDPLNDPPYMLSFAIGPSQLIQVRQLQRSSRGRNQIHIITHLYIQQPVRQWL